jgi:hypothetical protein
MAQKSESPKIHSAHKASVLSTIIPGAGQVYNKKYWKVPIIYASLATSIYFINENQNKYTAYKNAYLQRLNGEVDDYSELYNNSQLITIMDYYERNRDVSYIITAAIYLLNIVDASVDAHLLDFDVSDELNLSYAPSFINTPHGKNTSLSLKMNF